MITKEITYTDFNGNKRTEKFYFNLSKAEITEMELGETGGMSQKLERIVESQDNKEIVAIFKEIILKAYGEKSEDGRRFMKSKERAKAFEETEAYSVLFMELVQNEDAAAAFINGIIPQDVRP